MKFGFVTCVRLGLGCMEEIYAAGGNLDLAITLPDEKSRNKSGRVYLDEFCSEHDIPLIKTGHINDREAIDAITAAGIDWLFIIGWSQIAGPQVLAAPRRGVLGIHPTLLPEGRGRAPIPWAIIKGLRRTGVTLFKLDEAVDTGPIVEQEVLEIAPDETATSLYQRVTAAHRQIIRSVWPRLSTDLITLREQNESHATVWPGRTPADGEITHDMTIAETDRLVRGVTRPYPGAFFVERGGRMFRIWAGSAGEPNSDETAFPIEVADGTYYATEYEFVPDA